METSKETNNLKESVDALPENLYAVKELLCHGQLSDMARAMDDVARLVCDAEVYDKEEVELLLHMRDCFNRLAADNGLPLFAPGIK